MEKTTDVQVVMLPTGIVGEIPNGSLVKHIAPWGTGNLSIANSKYIYSIEYKPQHLYLTSDELIKEGDWSYCSIPNCTRERIIKVTDDWNLDSLNRFRKEGYESKIIATTNPECNLPTIPDSFLQKYVAANGNIDSVKLEMEKKEEALMREMDEGMYMRTDTQDLILKLTDKNEVVIVDEPMEKIKAQIAATLKWRKITDNYPKETAVITICSGIMGIKGPQFQEGVIEKSLRSPSGYTCKGFTDGDNDWSNCTHYIPISDLLQLPKED